MMNSSTCQRWKDKAGVDCPLKINIKCEKKYKYKFKKTGRFYFARLLLVCRLF